VAGDALSLSGELFLCADDVVVVGEGDLNEVAAAAQLAAALGGPLLHPHPQLAAELGRLKPVRIHLIGAIDVVAPPTAEVLRPTISETVEAARSALGVSAEIRLPARPDATTVIETMGAIVARDRVVLPQTDASVSTTVADGAGVDPAALIAGLARPTSSTSIWLVDAAQPVAILSAAATGRVTGATVVAYNPADILGNPEIGAAPGSVSQVRECAAALVQVAKERDLATVLVGENPASQAYVRAKRKAAAEAAASQIPSVPNSSTCGGGNSGVASSMPTMAVNTSSATTFGLVSSK